MKFFIKLFSVVLFMVGIFAISSCSSSDTAQQHGLQLRAPGAVSGGYIQENDLGEIILSIVRVRDASSYTLAYNFGNTHNNKDAYNKIAFNSLTYNISSIINEPTIYYFYVISNGDGQRFLDSEPSEIFQYDNSENLASPNLEIVDETLMWNSIEGASSYTVYRASPAANFSTISTSMNISNRVSTLTNIAEFWVVAEPGPGSVYSYKQSAPSNTIVYTKHLELPEIQNLRFEDVVVEADEEVEENVEENGNGEESADPEHEKYLKWDAIPRINSYEVVVNSEEFIVEENRVLYDEIIKHGAGLYNISVKPMVSGDLVDPGYTNKAYEKFTQLDIPIILSSMINDDEELIIHFTQVDNANSYTLVINSKIFSKMITNTAIRIGYGDLDIVEGEDLKLSIRANANNYFLASEFSQERNLGDVANLQAPTGLLLEEDGQSVILNWNLVPASIEYLVNINNSSYVTDNNYLDITEKISSHNIAHIMVKALNPISDYEDSDFSESIYINNEPDLYDGYSDRFFYYNGYNDYTVSTQQEMNDVIHWMINNRIEDESVHVIYSGTISDMIDKAISIYQSKYPYSESMLSYTVQEVEPDDIYQANIQMSYNFGLYPEETVQEDNFNQLQHTSPIINGAGRDEAHAFDIDSSNESIVVANTNSLMMALRNGVRPCEDVSDELTIQIYNQAREVLNSIISVSMTEVQQVQAIYEWVVYNTDFYSAHSVHDYYNNRSSYLEGVLVDNIANSQGIAQSIEMLLLLEGFAAETVYGVLEDAQEQDIAHFWNKVALDIDGSGYEWYSLDAYLSNKEITENNNLLVRNYFLINDAFLGQSHTEFEGVEYPVASEVFNFYEGFEYAFEYNYFASSHSDLENILHFHANNQIKFIEFAISSDTNLEDLVVISNNVLNSFSEGLDYIINYFSFDTVGGNVVVVYEISYSTAPTPVNLRVEYDSTGKKHYLMWDLSSDQFDREWIFSIFIEDSFYIDVSSAYFKLNEVMEYTDIKSFVVQARGDSQFSDSDKSKVFEYEFLDKVIDVPEINDIYIQDYLIMFHWDPVSVAETYTVTVNGQILDNQIDEESFMLDPSDFDDDELEIVVFSNKTLIYQESSPGVYVFVKDQVFAPENIVVDTSDESEIFVSWDYAYNAAGYYVYLDNDRLAYSEEVYFAFDSINLENAAYKVSVFSVSQTMRKSDNFNSAMFSNVEYSYQGFTDDYFFFKGEFYDYNIMNNDELQMLAGYIGKNQIEAKDVRFDYVSGVSAIGNEFNSAISLYMEAYPGSKYIPSLQYITSRGSDIYGLEFEHQANLEPSVSHSPTYSMYSEQNVFKSASGRSSSYNDFYTEGLLITKDVYSSTQLLEAVLYGARPTFYDSNSPAKIIYEMAKDVLREIIDDDMNEFEKVLAIHDWVAFNTVYDHDLYNSMDPNQPMSIDKITDIRAFFLEGVFIDGVAVCDGIAKAFALLVTMEGIENTIVIGKVGNTGHAWNKVYVEIDGVYDWYLVDVTWVGKRDAGTDLDERVFTRNYFMVSDEDVNSEEDSDVPQASISLNYYEHYYYSPVYNHYIEGEHELSHLLDYYVSNELETVEFKLSENYTGDLTEFFSIIGEYDDISTTQYSLGDGEYLVVISYDN